MQYPGRSSLNSDLSLAFCYGRVKKNDIKNYQGKKKNLGESPKHGLIYKTCNSLNSRSGFNQEA
jgi:hypothetical protein